MALLIFGVSGQHPLDAFNDAARARTRRRQPLTCLQKPLRLLTKGAVADAVLGAGGRIAEILHDPGLNENQQLTRLLIAGATAKEFAQHGNAGDDRHTRVGAGILLSHQPAQENGAIVGTGHDGGEFLGVDHWVVIA